MTAFDDDDDPALAALEGRLPLTGRMPAELLDAVRDYCADPTPTPLDGWWLGVACVVHCRDEYGIPRSPRAALDQAMLNLRDEIPGVDFDRGVALVSAIFAEGPVAEDEP